MQKRQQNYLLEGRECLEPGDEEIMETLGEGVHGDKRKAREFQMFGDNDRQKGSITGDLPSIEPKRQVYVMMESTKGSVEEIKGEINEVTGSVSEDTSVGVSRRFTANDQDIENFRVMMKKGIVWTKDLDLKLLRLSKKYGSRNYKAIS